MSTSLPSKPRRQPSTRFLKKISNRLLQPWREGAWRIGKDRRPAVRHRCLFHDDETPSAWFYPDDGWYFCWPCGRSYPLADVAEALNMKMPPPTVEEGRHSRSVGEDLSPFYQSARGEPTAVYAYRWPDSNEVSHYKVRWGHGRNKQISWQAPDHGWRKPDSYHPVYGDHLPPGLNLIVCEGEKAVNAITMSGSVFDNCLIAALTCGSKDDLNLHLDTLTARLRTLKPRHVLIWPDRDFRMAEWSGRLFAQLRQAGFRVARVNPRTLPTLLPKGGGPDDHMDLGGSLADVFASHFHDLMADQKIAALLDEVDLVEGGRFRLPRTRRLIPLRKDNIGMLWTQQFREPIPQALRDPLTDLLRARSESSAKQVVWRRWHDPARTRLVWRPEEQGRTVTVDQAGVGFGDDPPGALVMVPGAGDNFYDSGVDLKGSRQDLRQLCALFGLDSRAAYALEGWLLCALIGLQTPVLLLKGEAGSGKTTFGQALLSTLEPACPGTTLSSGNGGQVDKRELVNTLRQSVGVILDNVSSFSRDAEDLLCQLVTGAQVSQRRLYGDEIELIHMRRAVVITTTSWEVRKGDLATRLLPVHVPVIGRYLPEQYVHDRVNALLPRIRGHLFNQATRFYLLRTTYHPNGSKLRLADLGMVLETLHLDPVAVEEYLQDSRRENLNESDMWAQAMIEYESQLWSSRPATESWCRVTSQDIWQGLREQGVVDLPHFMSAAFHRWLRDANPTWRLNGFSLSYSRTNSWRGYVVTRELDA